MRASACVGASQGPFPLRQLRELLRAYPVFGHCLVEGLLKLNHSLLTKRGLRSPVNVMPTATQNKNAQSRVRAPKQGLLTANPSHTKRAIQNHQLPPFEQSSGLHGLVFKRHNLFAESLNSDLTSLGGGHACISKDAERQDFDV